MKCGFKVNHFTQMAVLAFSMVATTNMFAQQVPTAQDLQEAAQRTQYQQKLQQVIADMSGYATAIVQRWEQAAIQSGRWDPNYRTDLHNALMKLSPDNLLAVGEAQTFEAMTTVLATGRSVPQTRLLSAQPDTAITNSLGDTADDMVFTPVTPCRIIDTRIAGGIMAANTSRTFDVDGSTFTAQGGNNASCGIPFGAARAVAMTITVTQPDSSGWIVAWGLGAMPLSSVVNFVAGQTIANTTVVPVVPGGGNDFSLSAAGANAHVVVDVLGYFAAPVATALDCTTVSSALTSVPVNVWTNIDAVCPDGRTATGGGYNTSEGTGGYPGVWITTLPSGNGWRTWVDNQTNGARSIQTFANCCRIPGR